MSCAFRRTILGLVGLAAFWASQSCAICQASDTTATLVDDLKALDALASSLTRVVDAHLAFEAFKSERLVALAERGYASIREVGEQQLLVIRLQAQHRATTQFTADIQQVVDRVATLPVPSLPGNDPGNLNRRTFALVPPGSVRLVGSWEADGVAALPEANSASHVDLDELQQRVAVAQKRVQKLGAAEMRLTASDELRMAQMDLAIAEAESDCFQVAKQWQATRCQAYLRLVSSTEPKSDTQSNGTAIISASAIQINALRTDGDPRLLLATRRVAEAEAAATGTLQMARLAAQRQRLLLDSYQSLHAKGMASVHELTAAQQGLAEAEQFTKQLEIEHQQLEQLFAAIPSTATGPRAFSVLDELELDSIPLQLMNRRAAMLHLLGLRWQRYLTESEIVQAAARLQHQTSTLQKLQRIGRANSAATRELQFQQLDVDYAGADLLGMQERRKALRLEEVRYAYQVEMQSNRPTEVALAPLAGKDTRPLIGIEASIQAASTSYFESTVVESLASTKRLSPTLSIAAMDGFAYSTQATSPSPLGHLTSLYSPSVNRWGQPWSMVDSAVANSSTLFHYRKLPEKPGDFTLQGAQTSYRFPAYADFYQFGIRRPDLSPVESRATPYGGPWYFPGASTNFR